MKEKGPSSKPTHRCCLCLSHNTGYCPMCRTSEYCRTNEWVAAFAKDRREKE